MYKHGYLDQIPMFRIDLDNKIPYLGDMPHTPIALYIRKEGDQIVEITQLKTPVNQKNIDLFMEKIEAKTNIKGLKDKIKVDTEQHR